MAVVSTMLEIRNFIIPLNRPAQGCERLPNGILHIYIFQMYSTLFIGKFFTSVARGKKISPTAFFLFSILSEQKQH